jgi:hypothetical protein
MSGAREDVQSESLEADESSEVSEIVEIDEEISSPGGVMELDADDVF